MSSYPPRNREFQKNSKKIKKIKEYHQLKYSKNYKTPSQLLSNPKQVRKCREREKIKIKNHSDVFLPDPEQKIPKIKAKKFKKFENTIIASFQAKIGQEMLRKRENKKKIVPMSSYPTRNKKFQKKRKKIQKIKKKKT